MGIVRTDESERREIEELRRMLVAVHRRKDDEEFRGTRLISKDLDDDEDQEAKVVCVTSGVSFLGLAIVNRLLLRRYSVRIILDNQGTLSLSLYTSPFPSKSSKSILRLEYFFVIKSAFDKSLMSRCIKDVEKLRELENRGEMRTNNNNVSVITAKLTQVEDLVQAFDGCRGVFHTSAFTDPAGLSGYSGPQSDVARWRLLSPIIFQQYNIGIVKNSNTDVSNIQRSKSNIGNVDNSYSLSQKGYRCLHPSGKVYVSRHVVFNELEYPYKSLFPPAEITSTHAPIFSTLHLCDSLIRDAPSSRTTSSTPSDQVLCPTMPAIPFHIDLGRPTVPQVSHTQTSTHPMTTRLKSGTIPHKAYASKSMAEIEVKATENVIKACARTPSVRNCVLTSSLLACSWRYGAAAQDLSPVVNHDSWSDESLCINKKLWYALGKLRSEKAAWKLAEESGFKLTTICPGLITGPDFIDRNPTATIAYLKGAQEMYANGLLATVDVMRLADSHVCVYEEMNKTASGRYICFDRVIESEDEAEKLAKEMGMPANKLCGNACEHIPCHFELSNKKLTSLMSRTIRTCHNQS
ncbi:hypothetical protein EZV62_019926 [Acer yangbiense]|uniref:Retroviral polymerase SH3-like domain-containing protein n=1 Tax=Acer yangbiense TaxID=1000413 RepID=A0A5C7HC61_9ROSI|nr:hypothetical protein EZV62_019926 [Acer yangbiense]